MCRLILISLNLVLYYPTLLTNPAVFCSNRGSVFRRGTTRRNAVRTKRRYGRPRTRPVIKLRLTRPTACWTSVVRPARSTSSPKGSSPTTIPYCRASVGVIIKALAARKCCWTIIHDIPSCVGLTPISLNFFNRSPISVNSILRSFPFRYLLTRRHRVSWRYVSFWNRGLGEL